MNKKVTIKIGTTEIDATIHGSAPVDAAVIELAVIGAWEEMLDELSGLDIQQAAGVQASGRRIHSIMSELLKWMETTQSEIEPSRRADRQDLIDQMSAHLNIVEHILGGPEPQRVN